MAIEYHVVGKYINQTTRTERTVMMLKPEGGGPGSERYVTGQGECVFRLPDDESVFVSVAGEVLLPARL